MLAEIESYIFPQGRGSSTCEGQAYTEPSEQGKGFDLKIAPFEIGDEKRGINKKASKPADESF